MPSPGFPFCQLMRQSNNHFLYTINKIKLYNNTINNKIQWSPWFQSCMFGVGGCRRNRSAASSRSWEWEISHVSFPYPHSTAHSNKTLLNEQVLTCHVRTIRPTYNLVKIEQNSERMQLSSIFSNISKFSRYNYSATFPLTQRF